MVRVTPLLTSQKTVNVTMQTPQETLLGTPVTLPTSEPATPQIGYTVASEDLPTFNINPYSKKQLCLMIGAGKFVTSGTVYFRMKKNGSSVWTGSSTVATNGYYTIRARFYDVAIGDLLEIALWSNKTDSNWDYKAYQIQSTRLIPFAKIPILKPFNITSIATHPILTLGNPYYTTLYFIPNHDDVSLSAINTPKNYTALYCGSTYGVGRLGSGDSSGANMGEASTSGTYRPQYTRNYIPTQMVLRGLKID